jgi:ABC-type phosphate transport system substrate-binding protein
MGATRLSRIGRRCLLACAAIAFVVSGARLGAADDTIVVVVSAQNPMTEISRLHLADLYLGRTTRFPNGEAAEPIDQGAASPARAAFYQGYLGRSLAQVKAHWSKIVFTGRGRPPRDVPTCAEVKELVAGDVHAIGYVERRKVDGSVRVLRVE